MGHAVSIKEGAENMLHENAEELKVLTLFPFVFVLTIHPRHRRTCGSKSSLSSTLPKD